jgi:hypothetical protein
MCCLTHHAKDIKQIEFVLPPGLDGRAYNVLRGMSDSDTQQNTGTSLDDAPLFQPESSRSSEKIMRTDILDFSCESGLNVPPVKWLASKKNKGLAEKQTISAYLGRAVTDKACDPNLDYQSAGLSLASAAAVRNPVFPLT